MNLHGYSIAGMITILLLVTFLAIFIWIGHVDAYEFKQKNVTMEIQKNEMVWCYYGNPEKANGVCNSMEVVKDRKMLVDRFLDFLANGGLEREND